MIVRVVRALDVITELAEDPKQFLKVHLPVAYAITWADKTGRMHISRLSGTSPDDAVGTLHLGYQVLKVIEVKPIGRAAFADYQQQARYGESEDPKRFLKRVAPPTQFTVDSKWEDWTVDGQGNITAHGEAKSAGRPKWRNVKKFDVEGYQQRTGNYPTGVINIYDISYWQHDGRKITSPREMRVGRLRLRRPRALGEGANALQAAMRQATAEILADDNTATFGGGRKDGRRATDAYDINCGMCEEWANRVAELCPEAEAVGVGNLTGNVDDDLEHGHVFIRYHGKFYDCECSAGVQDWKQLFTRVTEAEGSKMRKRQKLFNGAVLDHSYYRRLVVKVIHLDGRAPNWAAYTEDGKQALPSCFSERGLHFMLRRRARYQIVNSPQHLEAPPLGPDPRDDPKLKAAQAEWLRRHNITTEAENPKKLFRELPRRHDIAAFSGDWVTDREGNVVAFTPDYNTHDDQEAKDIAHYESIKKFDFDEYRAYWGDLPNGMDISDVAYWTDDGTYHKANEYYRQDIKTGGIAR